MQLSSVDIAVVAIYVIVIVILAQLVSRKKGGQEKTTEDYFLAGKSIPWWAIGASLIAANISAEQIIGMSGAGYAVGLGIASYEWVSALILIVVAKYILPIFLRHRIYTMPQYLEQRYDHRVRMVMAIFWLGIYTFINLASVLWLGALAINGLAGLDLSMSLVLLAVLAVAYSLYGGLKAVALTDIVQVMLLVVGGLMVTYYALDAIGAGAGPLAGFVTMTEQLPEKFDLILSPDSPHYKDLPGISVLIGGMWVIGLSYWGFNQYIIQRALAAKNLQEAQKGLTFAAYLKLLIPIIVVFPGIAGNLIVPGLDTPDTVYPELMKLLPIGFTGLVFAALIAAILSSLGSMMNSVATIFTMDIYRHFKPDTENRVLVLIGRIAAVVAITIAVIVARPLLGDSPQAFQFIQEFTGFFTPGIVVLFLFGMFWKRTTPNAALTAAIGSFVLSLAFKIWWPELPFMDRVGLVFFLCAGLAVSLSLRTRYQAEHGVAKIGEDEFKTTASFKLAAVGIVIILAALYATWW